MKIPTYRAETQRGSGLATQLSNIQTTPDLFGGNLAKQVAETGNALAQWGLRKAEMAAESSSANAIRAFKSSAEEIQDNLFKTEGYDPLLGEEEYKRQIKDLIGVSGAELPNKRSRQLFQSAISDVADGYRRNFEKINNAKIIDKFKVDTEEEILSAKKIISNPKQIIELRLEEFQRIEQLLNSNALRLNLSATDIKKYKDAFYKSTFESTLLTRVRIGDDRDELLTDLEDGILDSNNPENEVLAELLNKVAPEDRIEIFDKAKAIDLALDKEALTNEKLIEDQEKKTLSNITNAFLNSETAEEALQHYKAYKKNKGFRKFGEQEKWEKHLSSLGAVGFDDQESESFFAGKTDGETIKMIQDAARNNTLTAAMLNEAASRLTKEDYKFVANLFKNETNDAIKLALFDIRAFFSIEEEEGKLLGKETDKISYREAQRALIAFQTKNPEASFAEITKEKNNILSSFNVYELARMSELQNSKLTGVVADALNKIDATLIDTLKKTDYKEKTNVLVKALKLAKAANPEFRTDMFIQSLLRDFEVIDQRIEVLESAIQQ